MNMRRLFTFLLLITSGILSAQSVPVANFSTFDTAICSGSAISFTDLSTNSPTSWKWTFIGAVPDTSTQQNPFNIIYPTAGYYPVKLVVNNGSGSDSLTIANYIHVYSRPNVYFTGATDLCQGSTTLVTAHGGI